MRPPPGLAARTERPPRTALLRGGSLLSLAMLCAPRSHPRSTPPAAVVHKQQEADVRASAAASALAAASADARHSKHHGPNPEELANLNVIVMSDVLARAEAAEKLVEAAKERAYNADRENARLHKQLEGEQGKTAALQRRVAELEAELEEAQERCQGLEEMAEESVGGSEVAESQAREAQRRAREAEAKARPWPGRPPRPRRGAAPELLSARAAQSPCFRS